MACLQCGGPQTPGERDQRRAMGDVVALIAVPTLVCSKCGYVLDVASRAQIDGAFARFLARIGAVSGNGFRVLREDLGLPGTQLAKLLNVRNETISRWENGKATVDRAAWGLLSAMVEEWHRGDTMVRDRLRAAAAPQLPRKPARIDIQGLEIARPAPTKMRGGKRKRRR